MELIERNTLGANEAFAQNVVFVTDNPRDLLITDMYFKSASGLA